MGVALLFTACAHDGNLSATHSPQPTVASIPSASPTPLGAQLAVPESMPVILYHDPANFDQLDGMTWSGGSAGRVGVGVTNGGRPNFDGTLYSVGGDVHDRFGNVVGQVPIDGKDFAGTWTDDGRHYCGVARISPDAPPTDEPGMLRVGALGQASHDVMRIGTFYPRSFNAGGVGVAACSLASDRAIVGQSGGQGIGTRQYWAVQLSTGHVLWSHAPPESSTGVVEVVASRDGMFVAEDQGVYGSIIYGPGGTAVAHLAGWVAGFSWDGSLVIVDGTPAGGSVSLIRWRDQTTLWKGPAGAGYGYWQGVAEPGGTAVAIGLRDPAYPQTTGFAPVDLYVVSGDGRLTLERKNIYLFTP